MLRDIIRLRAVGAGNRAVRSVQRERKREREREGGEGGRGIETVMSNGRGYAIFSRE